MTDAYWEDLLHKYENMPDEEFKSILDEVSALPDTLLAQEIKDFDANFSNEISTKGESRYEKVDRTYLPYHRRRL